MKPTTTPPEIATQQADPPGQPLSRRRETASRLAPLECGHRDPLDCRPDCGSEIGPRKPSPELMELCDAIDPGDIAGLWADAKSLFFAKTFPEYASPAWRALHPDDPKRLAAALDAAEKWRKYGDDVTGWLRDATAPKLAHWQGRTHAELAEARKPKPPRQMQATPGWPPIAVPGQPGRYLTHPAHHRQEMAA